MWHNRDLSIADSDSKLATLRSGEDLSNADNGKDLSIADSGLKILATLRSGEDLSIAAIEKLAPYNDYHKQHLQTKNTWC